MRGRLDAAFMRAEPHAENLVYRRVLTEPLILVFPSDHRLAAQEAVDLREVVGETFIIPSNTAPTLHSLIAGTLERSGLDIKPAHEVDHLAHAVSMVASTGAVMLLPAYARSFLPSSVTSRPLGGTAPTIDLVVGFNKTNRSPVLKLFLSRLDEIAAAQSQGP
jgi:LysR family hca operon transcriptional activator